MLIIKKRFIAKQKIKINLIKVIIYLIIASISLVFTFKILFKINLSKKLDNKSVINYLLSSGTNNMLGKNADFRELFSINFASPAVLIRLGFNNMLPFKDSSYAFSDADEEENGLKTEYIEDPHPVNVDKPIVYIYNTHQLENYSMAKLEPYNIKPNVLMTSYILREKLNDLGIPTIVETRDIGEILRINNWKYKYSYEASRLLVKDALEENSSIKYLIDLHRDSSSYEKTITEIKGVKYAKILWVVGKEHKDYEKNLAITKKLNDLLIAEDSSLSRGITIKEGKGVNGIYNQDLSPNSILVEMGGQYNSIDEVNNTIPILAKILYKYIEGDRV